LPERYAEVMRTILLRKTVIDLSMGKQQLKKYFSQLSKEDLEDQIIELYTTSKEVKKYYDFLLNPDIRKIIDEWKAKISKEYFPVYGKRVKARRSIGQKAIRELSFLGVPPDIIADIRLYAIEIAILFTIEQNRTNVAFFKSFETQFKNALDYMHKNGILSDFKSRCRQIVTRVNEAQWSNRRNFELLYARYQLKHKQ